MQNETVVEDFVGHKVIRLPIIGKNHFLCNNQRERLWQKNLYQSNRHFQFKLEQSFLQKSNAMAENNYIQSIIYTVRGHKVMIDSDLAAIYGYETKAFNQQVKNNIQKFDDDFRFQLTK